MNQLFHFIQIQATPQKVYAAISTKAGLESWLSSNCEFDLAIDAVAIIWSNNSQDPFRMKIMDFEQDKRLVWKCLGDNKDWIGTEISFELLSDKNLTSMHFNHCNWRETGVEMSRVNTIWGELLHRLKSYCEIDLRNPKFN